jgi:predicted nucleic acid-binding protein
LLDFEVVSALRGLTLGRHLTAARAEDASATSRTCPCTGWAYSAPLRLRAFSLRDTLAADDAVYVALAEALECPLVTRDARLARAGGHDVEIRVR